MIHRWIPWKFIVKKAAKAYGIIDPISVMARVRRFAQPSEVQEPIELLRAGIVFHARGLINTKAIQHNLDWVWPYWVERQFNPRDVSFIPRGFSFSHVNLTHRNWTAVGLPGLALYPIVDPRGLFTPLYDGWSLDFWLRLPDGRIILPSRQALVSQTLRLEPELQVRTELQEKDWSLRALCFMELDARETPQACMQVVFSAPAGSSLILAFRPYNPEGVQFIEKAAYDPAQRTLQINGAARTHFSQSPQKVVFSEYTQGDVLHKLDETEKSHAVSCKVGMATAAAVFPLYGQEQTREVTARIPLSAADDGYGPRRSPPPAARETWPQALDGTCTLRVPDRKLADLYHKAVHTLILLSTRDVVPGPYTYRRFWFRDACFMLHALLNLGLTDTVHRIIQAFPHRQKTSGYFQSQAGEWDSNGQVLWLLDRFEQLSGRQLAPAWIPAVRSACTWIETKRISMHVNGLHAGLLPAGFSAEHLGPNDYYYWDNFWAVGGLHSAARILQRHGQAGKARSVFQAGDAFLRTIWNSQAAIPDQRKAGGIPASPYRRLDAGAVGSLVADYPLQISPAADERILRTTDFLIRNCFHRGGFFQDMIHSGINPYLTLCIAQTLLRAQDMQCMDLIHTVADLASPTGQWPEAVHPLTHGGCMGDGQHGWAASEWVMIMRNLFVREEGEGLFLGSGLDPEWVDSGERLECGPTLTPFGRIQGRTDQTASVRIQGTVDPEQTPIQARIPGYEPLTIRETDREILVRRS
ncbi:hypothetical protein [Desulfovermiculus halophilus]|jgi:hypothetical protein|uniref:hypothetical protein n=1 Tax=Desulfovermiculus halophilus TaxID=339722 RepID=UPI000481276A|nr:hypothetical protein [Desulfovermiculus halophilus]